MQNTDPASGDGYLPEDRVEPEGKAGAQSATPAETEGRDGAQRDVLLERLLDWDNLLQAVDRVRRNKGAPGVDGMTVLEARDYFWGHVDEISEKIRKGRYRPTPVRRKEIPKPDGGVRALGIPTAVDRIVQQALAQVLTPVFNPGFSKTSYGFRRGKSAHQAIWKAREYYMEGYTHVVDIDLAKYFDTVNHEILMDMVMEKVKSRPVLKLIRSFLKSGVAMPDGLVTPTEEGTPQGGPLSPLLSNIYLNRFDKWLEERGHRFVRYADDCNIYLKSRRAAQRVMEHCVAFLEGERMRLKVNRQKSATGSPLRLKFLGFVLYVAKGGTVGIRPHSKSKARLKEKVRKITKRNRGKKFDDIVGELRLTTIGWINYYGICDMKAFMQEMDGWTRRRLRMYIWKMWKRIKTRCKALMRLGIEGEQAWMVANTRKGYWRSAQNPVINRAINNKILVRRGFDELTLRYEEVHSRFRTAGYGTVWPVV